MEVEVSVEVDSQKSPEHSLSLETVAYIDVHRVDDSKEVESEVSTMGYSRKSCVGDDIILENQEEEVSDLASQAIQGAVKLTHKRDKSVSPKLTKRAKFSIASQLEKYVVLTDDLNKMEQYISLAQGFQLKLNENLIALGVSNDVIKVKIEERCMSTEDLHSGSVELPDFSYQSHDENLDTCYSPISMDENVRSDS